MKYGLLAVMLSGAIVANAHASCGSSFCVVNTHWDTQGLANDSGLRVDLRYTYAKADAPRIGSSRVTNDPALAGAGEEVENLRTINRTVDLSLDYPVAPQWNIAVDLPWVMRDHAHTIAGTPDTVEQGSFSEFGDARILGSYRFDTELHGAGSGIRFGLKLPTGRSTWEFQPGTPGERSLQPGSGSTDAIIGAYRHGEMSASPWGWFASAQIQTALTTRDDYRPGNTYTFDAGTHYPASPELTLLLQMNAQIRTRDSGVNANPHSGGKTLSLSPGASYAVADRTRVYGFLQLPVYQYSNPDPAGGPFGQLTAPWSFSIGVSHSY